jgi:hypothetical protein
MTGAPLRLSKSFSSVRPTSWRISTGGIGIEPRGGFVGALSPLASDHLRRAEEAQDRIARARTTLRIQAYAA